MDQSIIAPADAHRGNVMFQTVAHGGADGRIHTGRIPTAGENADSS